MTMVVRAFVDTNFLLRAYHRTFSEHERAQVLFDEMLDAGYELWISRQIIREYLVQVTHPRTFTEPLSIDVALVHLDRITDVCHVADETEHVTSHLFILLSTYPTTGKQVHDANIVATMLTYDIDTLLTLNIADLKRFSDKIRIISLEDA